MKLLEGICVIDLSSLMAGPYCTMLLADMGADVIKVEDPKGGDPVRALGPPFIKGESCLFLSLNRNKRGITLDLNRKEGQEILYRLVERADCLIENFLPHMAKAMGINYERIVQIKKDIIYCSLSAFGKRGPLQNKPGTDPIFQGMSGVMMINGRVDDPPFRLGFPVADITAGIFAALAIVSSLFQRERSGRSHLIDISILHSLIALQTPRIAEYLATGKNPERLERASAFATPSQYFQTKDSYINVSAFSNKFWKRLCEAIGMDELLEEIEFSTPEKRMINREKLIPILETAFKKKSLSEWMKILEEEEIPHGPIYTYEDMFRDENLQISNYLVEFIHPVAGRMKAMGLPFHTLQDRTVPEAPPPLLGQHTEEVLEGIGLTEDEISKLREAMII